LPSWTLAVAHDARLPRPKTPPNRFRKKELECWDRNKESNRAWLALNMMTEGQAGFRAFHDGSRETGREVDFVEFAPPAARGEAWGEELTHAISPQHRGIRA
jgi:6-oxo-cyclohex-1-ene-carbonyl-CoA hydrolase